VAVKLTIPDLGDFADVEVIEIVASPGDVVAVEDPLITLETDKATMDVPAEAAGTIVSIDVKVGDRVSRGDPLVTIEPADDAPADEAASEEVEDTRKMSKRSSS
jgi:pyruvate/2-oxoglutarate dehydrogenase complex dihydrolipoamide acyltransferase (E2) component